MDYIGLDYSNGKSNIDEENGIHYGIINQNSVMPEAFDDLFYNSRDLTYEQCVADMKSAIKTALHDALSDTFSIKGDTSWYSPERGIDLDEITDGVWDSVEQDFNDAYQPEEHEWLYESDGYKLTNCLTYDIFILKSPFYTRAQYCSPCVPGAGNIDNPMPNGVKTYCLGVDWFEDGKAPYPYYKVSDDSIVYQGDGSWNDAIGLEEV